MNKLEFNFGEASFNKLFPFFILTDSELIIKGIGKSLAKISSEIHLSDNFTSHFRILKPSIEDFSYQSIVENINQLIILKLNNANVQLRGQFELLDGNLLFVGTP